MLSTVSLQSRMSGRTCPRCSSGHVIIIFLTMEQQHQQQQHVAAAVGGTESTLITIAALALLTPVLLEMEWPSWTVTLQAIWISVSANVVLFTPLLWTLACIGVFFFALEVAFGLFGNRRHGEKIE